MTKHGGDLPFGVVLSFFDQVDHCVTDEVGRGRNATQRGGNYWDIDVRLIAAVRGDDAPLWA